MKSGHLWATLIATVAICTTPALHAATVTVHIDDQSMVVPTYESDGNFFVGTPTMPGFSYNSNGNLITLQPGLLDPDPSIIFAGAVVDVGAPSSFGFTFILPLSPIINNPSSVFDSFSTNVTNGLNGGVTATALPPPAGVPEDGDGVTEMQVFTLSDDNGATWKNVGLDAGPSFSVLLPPGGSAFQLPFNQGFIPTIAGGPWTHMRADVNFRLSGGNDRMGFVGAKVLIPEPSALLLAMFAIASLSMLGRRSV